MVAKHWRSWPNYFYRCRNRRILRRAQGPRRKTSQSRRIRIDIASYRGFGVPILARQNSTSYPITASARCKRTQKNTIPTPRSALGLSKAWRKSRTSGGDRFRIRMKWNFPIRKTIKCASCGKQFEIVLANRSSERHKCPHCGTVHRFDFAAAEKQALAAAKQEFRKAFHK